MTIIEILNYLKINQYYGLYERTINNNYYEFFFENEGWVEIEFEGHEYDICLNDNYLNNDDVSIGIMLQLINDIRIEKINNFLTYEN